MKTVFIILGAMFGALLGLLAAKLGYGANTWQYYVLVLPSAFWIGMVAGSFKV